MKQINLLLSMIVKNEADRYLEQALQSAKEYVDFILIVDDASTDETINLCEEILAEFPHHILPLEKSLFENETQLRALQWRESQKLNPEWILVLDADEFFEESIVSEIDQLLASDKDAHYFRLYDFWSGSEYREGDWWQAHKYYRPFLVRNKPDINYTFPDAAQHCGRFPQEIVHFPYALSNVRIKHMGWSKKEDRQKKYQRYLKLDPGGQFGNLAQYNSILDEHPTLIPFEGVRKVLVGSPIHQKPLILKEFLKGLSRLQTTGIDLHFMLVDDNENPASSALLETFKEEHDRVTILPNTEGNEYNPESHHWRNEVILKVGKNKDKILQQAKEEQFDFVFLVDSDLVLHPRTLLHLTSFKKDIVSEVFYTAWTEGGLEMPQVWLYDTYEFIKSKDVTPDEKAQAFWQFLHLIKKPGLYPVGGLGACTLISKQALEAGVAFEPIYNLTFWGEDRHFCVRAAALGLQLHASTYLPPFHIYRDRDLEKVSAFWEKV